MHARFLCSFPFFRFWQPIWALSPTEQMSAIRVWLLILLSSMRVYWSISTCLHRSYVSMCVCVFKASPTLQHYSVYVHGTARTGGCSAHANGVAANEGGFDWPRLLRIHRLRPSEQKTA